MSCICRMDQTASLDRIDSNFGYTETNVQWVHKELNIMKWNLTDKSFVDWCEKILRNRRPELFSSD